jgi:hypothetical protein
VIEGEPVVPSETSDVTLAQQDDKVNTEGMLVNSNASVVKEKANPREEYNESDDDTAREV